MQEWLEFPRRVPILIRALIANALVVVVGATVGTILTKTLVDLSAFTLAVIFATIGVALSVVINYIVLRITLQPLSSLTSTVNQIQDGQTALRIPLDGRPDPDIAHLSEALNTMLDRLAAHTLIIESNHKRLQALSAQVIAAQEEERNRIARELHDETSQALAGLLIALKRIDDAIPDDLMPLKEQLEAVHSLASETLDGLHILIANLRPPLLDDLGLLPAIRWYARQRLESRGIDLMLDTPPDIPRLSSSLETAVFRIMQEAVNNIVKHADASEVRLHMDCTERLTLVIEDDGVGFDPDGHDSPFIAIDNLGLLGVRERAAAFGGEVEISTAPGSGTRVCVTLPLDEALKVGSK